MPACTHVRDVANGREGPVARTFPGDDGEISVGMMCGDCGKHLTSKSARIMIKHGRSTLSAEERAKMPTNALPAAPIDLVS